jgi:hypothetical protein
MKKTTTILIGLLLTLAIPAYASTDLNLSFPKGNTYESGDIFTANVNIVPGEKIYTVGINLDYPANLLQVQSFNFSSSWMPLSQEGYDSINNTTGLLIKTAGYPGGFESSKNLGTVTFKAIKEGTGRIELTSETFALNAQNGNMAEDLGFSQITVEKTGEKPIVGEEPITEEPVIEEEPTVEEPVIEEEPVVGEELINGENLEEIATNTSFLAAVENILSLGSGNNWVIVLLIISIAAIIIALISIIKKKKIF